MEELLRSTLILDGCMRPTKSIAPGLVGRRIAKSIQRPVMAQPASGCLQLLEYGEPDCATDLGKQIIEMYTEAGIQEIPENLDPLVQIIRAYPEER